MTSGISDTHYRISAYSFLGNYSLLKVEKVEIFIQFPHYGNFLLHKLNSCHRNRLLKWGNCSREETIRGNTMMLLDKFRRNLSDLADYETFHAISTAAKITLK